MCTVAGRQLCETTFYTRLEFPTDRSKKGRGDAVLEESLQVAVKERTAGLPCTLVALMGIDKRSVSLPCCPLATISIVYHLIIRERNMVVP